MFRLWPVSEARAVRQYGLALMKEAGQHKAGRALAARPAAPFSQGGDREGKARQGGGSPPHEPACGYGGAAWELTWERRGAVHLSATQWWEPAMLPLCREVWLSPRCWPPLLRARSYPFSICKVHKHSKRCRNFLVQHLTFSTSLNFCLQWERAVFALPSELWYLPLPTFTQTFRKEQPPSNPAPVQHSLALHSCQPA